jgi:hypothetical protein
MIDPNLAGAFDRLAVRQHDVLHAFEPGFEPERADVAGRAGVQPDANPLHVVAPESTYFVSGTAGGTATFSRAGTFAVDGGLPGATGPSSALRSDAPASSFRCASIRTMRRSDA